MKKLLVAIWAMTVLSSVVAQAQVTSYNNPSSFSAASTTTVQATFESFPVAPANLGSNIADGCVNVSFSFANQPPGTLGIAVLAFPNTKVLSAHGNEDLTLTFSPACTGPTAVGFDTYTNRFSPPTVTVVDSNSNVTTFTLSQAPNSAGFFGVTSPVPIVSIRWFGVNGNPVPPLEDTAIDNIRVGVVQAMSEFQINFTTFIQGNSLIGPPQSRCGRGEQLFFAGDDRRPNPSATSFRTRQLVTVITDQSVDADGIKDGTGPQNLVGVTKSYAPDALPTIDASDDDYPNLLDCHLLHEMAQASNLGMRVSVTRTGPQSLSIHLQGSVGNPLVLGAGALAPIDWDLTLRLDTSGPVPSWALSGTDDGFPSWELYANDNPIYIRNAPPPYTLNDLRKLLPVVGDIQVNASGQL